jgi:hypothetical protein
MSQAQTATIPTPSSEKSVYYDAPIMHFFTRSNSKRLSKSAPDAAPNLSDNPGQDVVDITPQDAPEKSDIDQPNGPTETNSNGILDHKDDNTGAAGGADVTRQPSVAIAKRPMRRDAAHDDTASDYSRNRIDEPGSSAGTAAPVYDYAPDTDTAIDHSTEKREEESQVNDHPIQNYEQDAVDDDNDITSLSRRYGPAASENSGAAPILRAPVSSDSHSILSSSPSAKRHAKSASAPNGTAARARSTRSAASAKKSTRASTIRSQASGVHGMADGGSAFVNGPATTGPLSSPSVDSDIHLRAAAAEAALTPKQRSKIAKQEIKEGKRLSKVIKNEGKAEQIALDVAIKELSELQQAQKVAVKVCY